MDDADYWLALQRAPGLGARSIVRLLEHFPQPREVFAAARDGRPDLGIGPEALAYLRSPDWAAIEADREWLSVPSHHLVTLTDPRYPPLLAETGDPPLLLFVHGRVELLAGPQLAIVGSRHPTPGGARSAFEFANYLAGAGLTITSGLAQGIDGASHRGALEGGGPTVAVVGTGLDRVYPARHRELAQRIVEHGALVSEYPLGTPPRAGHFPQRNRVIAGLSVGALVVEAASNSGSLITARLAAEAGREVFAIPGSIHNPLARGCHRLIRQGAKLVERAEDVLEELPWLPVGQGGARAAAPAPDGLRPAEGDLDADYRRLLDCMGYDPVSVDALVERSGLTAEAVSSMLLLLELRGCVSALSGGLYTQVSRGS